FGNGVQSTVDLPTVAPKGIMLQVKDTLGKVSVNIVCNKSYLQDNQNKDVNLVILSSGKLRTVNTKLDSRVMGMDLPEDQFAPGIMQITLFSQDGEPLSERLVFIQNSGGLNITVSTDKQSYKTRDKVSVNFNAKANGMSTQGFFSGAVVDDSRVPYDDNNETTILSYLLLTSDLKGYIEQPNYYFTKTPKAQMDLDNLMLTQGYRRFTWKQVLTADGKPFAIAPEKNLFLSGTEKTNSGAPVANKEIILNEGTSVLTTKTDASGKFLFDNMTPFYAGAQFTLQATGSTRDKNSTTITVDKQPEPPVENSTFMGNLSQLTSGASNSGSAGAVPSSGDADQVIDGTDISGASSMTAALSGKLNGVTFASGQPYLKGNKYPMLIVVDGNIRTGEKIDNILPDNVKNVKLLKGVNAGAYGASGNSGVLVINTRGGNVAGNSTIAYESQNVTSATPIKEGVANYRSSSLAGPGHADQVVMGDAIMNAPTLTSGLNGILRGVDFTNGVPILRGGNVVTFAGGSAEPMYVILDGTPYPGPLDNISPHSVEAVEVLKGANASIYGTAGGAGVLVITTRNQAPSTEASPSSIGSLTFKPLGYYKLREFYSPKYDVASNVPGSAPDRRSTIFWSPSLATDKDGNASFEFYNSDGKGSYRVIIEGIDGNGNPGRAIYRYKVE
ncbi:MAG: TonB-dependent receptor plug domain-containing protein, partial [Bacteroidetes bacterium]|nr:TonB-dependent receptor plug domain-containing protein [Bacteroidota bacterium]